MFVLYRIALLIPLEFPTFLRVLNNGVKFFNLVRRNIVIFPLLACRLYFGFINIPLLLRFLLGTLSDIDDHTADQIVLGPDVTCLVSHP